jgi:tetratricopeptide (TPR) repeat protein
VTYTGLFDNRREVVRVEGFQNKIEYFERMVTDNPDNPTGLLALANEYQRAERYEDEAAVLGRYVASHPNDEGTAYAQLGDVLSRLRQRRGTGRLQHGHQSGRALRPQRDGRGLAARDHTPRRAGLSDRTG